MVSIFKITKSEWSKSNFYQEKLKELLKFASYSFEDEMIILLYNHIDSTFNLQRREEICVVVSTFVYLVSAYDYVAYGQNKFVTTTSNDLDTILKCQLSLKDSSISH
ncbi:hypothetical protein [Priestia megaterium]|uniref:hypothetical protein n=1 Tax=Priestia megaterium TaxID=1404 RepID=UPI003D02437C